VKVARIEIYASRWFMVGLLLTPSFTKGKDYTAELLCEEVDTNSPLGKGSQVKTLKKLNMTFLPKYF
jgi:hypothetical protein